MKCAFKLHKAQRIYKTFPNTHVNIPHYHVTCKPELLLYTVQIMINLKMLVHSHVALLPAWQPPPFFSSEPCFIPPQPADLAGAVFVFCCVSAPWEAASRARGQPWLCLTQSERLKHRAVLSVTGRLPFIDIWSLMRHVEETEQEDMERIQEG